MDNSLHLKKLPGLIRLGNLITKIPACSPMGQVKFFLLIPVLILFFQNTLLSQCDDFFVDIITDPPYLTYCPGDTVAAIAIVTGGTPPYTFEWQPGGNTDSIEYFIAPTGWYDVCVIVYDANGCSFVTCEHIKPELYDAWAYNVGMGCPGGTNELFVDLGNSSHNVSFLWSTGDTTNPVFVSSPGTYTVTVTELATGCVAVLEAESYFTNNPEPEIAGPDVICPGETPTLYISGGSSWWDYLWGPGGETTSYIIVDTPGTYSVTVTDQIDGCVGTASVEIQSATTTPLQFDAPSQLCNGASGTINILNPNDYSFIYWNTAETTSSITVTNPGTYAVTATELNGCQVFGQVTIDDSIANPPAIIGDNFICPNQSSVQLSVEDGFDQYLWSTGENTQSISVSAAGIYYVTVTDGNNCTAVGSHQIDPGSAPEPFITQEGPPCQNSTVTLSATGSGAPFQSYLWSTGETTEQILVSQSGSYSVTVTNTNGCSGGSGDFSVNFNMGPEASISSSPGNCNDSFVLLEASGGPYYQWSTGETSPTITVFNNGTYTVTVSDDNGCTATAFETITIPEPPTVQISGPFDFCDGEFASLSASPGFSNYIWSNGQNTQQINVSLGGIYSVTVTDEFGCTASNEHLVSVIPLPQPQINGPDAICSGSTAELQLNQSFYQILWSTGQNTPVVSVTTPDTYSVTVTSNDGCVAVDSHVLAELPPPTVDITGPSTICSGGGTILAVPDSFNDILWNTGENTPAIQVNQSGIYSVTVVDNNGCSANANHTLDIGDSLNPEITVQSAGCNGTALLDAGGGYDSYLWSNGATTQQITVTANGNYSVSVSDIDGCFGDNFISVSIPEPPEVTITGPALACDGSPVMLAAEPGFASYLWSTGNTSESILVEASNTFSLTVTDSNGCSDIADHNIQISPLPTVDISGPDFLCQGTLGTLSASGNFQDILWSTGGTTSQIPVSQSGTYQATVTDENGCTDAETHQVETGDSLSVVINLLDPECSGEATLEAQAGFTTYNWSTGSFTQSILVDQSGNYSVTVSDINGCTTETEMAYEMMTAPELLISGPDLICTGNSDTIFATGNYQEILWSTGETQSNIIISQPGTYQATVTDENGCTSSTGFMVEVADSLSPQIILTGPDCEGNAIISVDEGFSSYEWSNGSIVNEFTVNASGSYFVTVTDENGCTGSGYLDLNIPDPPQISISGPSEACEGTSGLLTADPGFNSYLWSTGATLETINVNFSDTYSVTATDANGCTATFSVDFQSIPLPNVQITGPESLCIGDSSSLSITGIYDEVLWNTGEDILEIMVSQTGNYSVIVTGENGCTATADHMVEVADSLNPQIILTGPDCEGNAIISIDEGFSSYEWSNGNNSNEFTVNTSGTYTVTVTDENGCVGTGSLDLNIPAPPQVNISGPTETCEGTPELLTADPGFVSYLWSTGATSETISVNTSDTYSVSATDTNGCTATFSVDFQSMQLPSVQITGPATICDGDSSSLSISGTYDQVLWNTGENNLEILISQSGNYFVMVTNENGCTASASHLVEVTDTPIPQILLTGPDCEGNAIISVDEGFSSYEWSDGSISNEFTVNTSGTYSVTVTDEFGCTGTETLDLNIPALPQVNISGPTEACEGTPELLTADPGFVSYLWSTGATSETISVNITDTYSVSVTDANGCTATFSVDFESLPLPNVQITGPEFLCNGDSSSLSISGTYDQIQWNTGGSNSEIMISQSGNYSVMVTDENGCTASAAHMVETAEGPIPQILLTGPDCEGNAIISIDESFSSYEWSNGNISNEFTVNNSGTYSVTVTDENGCTGTGSLDLDIPDPPEVSISGPTEACEGTSGLLTADPGFVSYLWSTGATSETISVNTTDTYSVSATDANGCTATFSVEFQSLPLPDVQITGPEFICSNDVAVLSIEGSFSEITWNTGQTGNSIEVSQSNEYSAQVTDAYGCSSMATFEVSEFPNVDFELEVSPTCPEEANGTIEVHILSGTAPYLFFLNDNEPQSSAIFTGLPRENHLIVVLDDNGCASEMPMEMPEAPPLEITVQDQEISCDQSSAQLQPEVLSGDLANLQWNWSTGSTHPWIVVDKVGRYVVEVSDQCSTVQRGIHVNYANELQGENLFYVPNVFSPNDDGINDYFQVFPKPDLNILEFEFRVFDRWGEQMFVTNDVEGKWDGFFRGVQMHPAVFVWYIRARVDQCGIREINITNKGDVVILR